MKVESHIVDKDYKCSRCGLDFRQMPALTPQDFSEIVVGNRIGVISGLRFSEPSIYLIRKPENDSNKLCAPKA